MPHSLLKKMSLWVRPHLKQVVETSFTLPSQDGVEGELCGVLIGALGFHIVFLGIEACYRVNPREGVSCPVFLSVFLAEGEALKPFLVPIPKPSPHLLRTRVQERLKITCLCRGS